MRSIISSKALAAAVLGLLFASTQAQTPAANAPGAIQTLGCYKSAGSLVQNNNDNFQASGICQTACTKQNHPVMATIGGSTCYCGDELPALDQEVDPTKCNIKCAGYGLEMCGGIGYYQLYLTGITGDVQTAPNSTDTSSTGAATSSTKAAQTVVVTQSPSGDGSGGGPNKVGIAVGVVVGVVVVAGLIGGVIFFMRQKRKREIEEEYKSQLAINSFVSGSKSSETKSATDSRLDQSVFSARRESVGSIADERDFSRRILQVRNPDQRGSTASFA